MESYFVSCTARAEMSVRVSVSAVGNVDVPVAVRVNLVAMFRVSKLLGSNINPNPNRNSALTLIMTLNSH